MEVFFYFLFALAYLFFAGYGVTGLVSSLGSHNRLFILLNGYGLSIILFSESRLLFSSPTHSLWATVAICAFLNCLYVYVKWRRKDPSSRWGAMTSRRARSLRVHIAPYALALLVVALLSSSFAVTGWHGFWGTGNEDIFDALKGRDVFVDGSSTQMSHFLDPTTIYQYTSMAFWSLLLRSYDEMNVFYLQGLVMILLQILGTYFLCRSGFRFNHKLSLFCSFLGAVSAFYVSTFYAGHEGSIIFGGVIPYVLGLSLDSIRRRKLTLQSLAFLLLWLFLIGRTYIFPLGFTLIPFILHGVHRLVFGTPRFKTMLKNAFSRSVYVRSLRKQIQLKWVALGVLTIIIIVGGYFFVEQIQSILEPIRIRATTKHRAWAISHYKEMALIYWGVLPASIPYGSVGSLAASIAPSVVGLGFLAVLAYTLLVVYGVFKLWTNKNSSGAFLSVFAASWVIFFLVMKYLVVDSYYLYKFLYTNYFLGAVILGFSFHQLLTHVHFATRPVWERTKRTFVRTIVFFLVSSNLVYIVLYNIDLLSRPYNSRSADFRDVGGLMPYASAGIFFNLPRYDYQDLIRYILSRRGVSRPELLVSNYEYELEVKGIRDILHTDREETDAVWQNDVYRLAKAPEMDRLAAYSYYQGEERAGVCNNHPFRWVQDAISLDVINPSGNKQSLLACIEPGPGLGYRPFCLRIYINGALSDSIIVKGMQAVVLPLQGLDKYINTIKLVNKEHGKNLLPWEERYLNYRVSLLGLTNQKLSIEALKLLNTQDDIVPSSSWSRLMSAPERFSDTANLLCIWNNWGPLEDWGGRRFRWVNNDAELLLFSPSEETRSLILELERGPSLPPAGATVIAYVNGAPSDTATITGFHRAMMRLPDVLQKENLVRLHVTAEGKPSENDPRVLNFRVFRISLSDN